jgi:hypothetical protein
MVTCTSFCASRNVSAVTGGPTGEAVPKAGGAPGGDADESIGLGRSASGAATAVADASTVTELAVRKFLREKSTDPSLPDSDLAACHILAEFVAAREQIQR